MKKVLLFLTLIFCLSLSGCGYSAKSSLPSDLRTIYVADFKNKVDFSTGSARNLYLPLLEVKVRDAIVDRFQFDGSLRITNKERANLVLEGELTNYDRSVLRYQDNNSDVLEYRVSVSVNLKMTDTAKKEVFWEEPGFTGEATYLVSGPGAKTEDAAVLDAITDLAKRVVERTIENW